MLFEAGVEIGDSLHWAIQGGNGGIASDLLERGASTVAKIRNAYTPLHLAAYQEKVDMVKLLLLKGADSSVFENHEWTPLLVAVYEGRVAHWLSWPAARMSASNTARRRPQ